MKLKKPTNKDGKVSLRLSQETLSKLTRIADRAKVSLSEAIRQILERVV